MTVGQHLRRSGALRGVVTEDGFQHGSILPGRHSLSLEHTETRRAEGECLEEFG